MGQYFPLTFYRRLRRSMGLGNDARPDNKGDTMATPITVTETPSKCQYWGTSIDCADRAAGEAEQWFATIRRVMFTKTYTVVIGPYKRYDTAVQQTTRYIRTHEFDLGGK